MPVHTLRIYSPHSLQLKVHESKARFRIVVAARQVGKSTWCLNEILKKAWEKPNGIYYFISPTFDGAKLQFRRLLKQLNPCFQVVKQANQSELRIALINGSTIAFKSGEQLDTLRGATLDGVVIDEYREQHETLWPLIVQPMLATTGGWAAIVSTPSGLDQFFDLVEKAKADTTGQWEVFHAESTANPFFTQQEFERLKKDMSEAEFAQEILAEFRDITSGKTYLNHGPWNQRMSSPFAEGLYSPHLPIIVGCDFNTGLCVWELGQNRGQEFYWADEIALRNTHTQEMTLMLIHKVKEHKPGIILIGDATGKARKTSAAGQTDYSIIGSMLDQAKIPWQNRTPESNPPVKDRVNVINAKLKSADGTTTFWYHPINCKEAKKDFERVVWKQGATGAILDQIKDPERTHASDAMSYPTYLLSDHWQAKPGSLRIIRRR